MKNLEFDLKWVHMAQYELILRLDGALWLRIISGPLLTPKKGAPGVLQAVLEMCAWGLFAMNIYTLVRPRAYPCTL